MVWRCFVCVMSGSSVTDCCASFVLLISQCNLANPCIKCVMCAPYAPPANFPISIPYEIVGRLDSLYSTSGSNHIAYRGLVHLGRPRTPRLAGWCGGAPGSALVVWSSAACESSSITLDTRFCRVGAEDEDEVSSRLSPPRRRQPAGGATGCSRYLSIFWLA